MSTTGLPCVLSQQPLNELFRFKLQAIWDIYGNGGNTLDGGGQVNQFLVWQGLLYKLLPLPVSRIAWFVLLYIFLWRLPASLPGAERWGRAGTAALIAGLIFALAPEMATLINAGHVLKIATISFAPWAFFCLAKGYQEKRLFWFLATGCVLALQFFHTHWQIAYYTCLAIGLYGLFLLVAAWRQPQQSGGWGRLQDAAADAVGAAVFFRPRLPWTCYHLRHGPRIPTVAPTPGQIRGRGGLDREEAMQWSMPPEELATFLIPGMFGLSRQEAGDKPMQGEVYYWGRMVFTQTSSYIGLLPWLLLPLPLIFLRDRQTWFCLAIIGIGLLIAMGKYTPVYHWLYDYFPGMNRFRVPKMILFIPLIALCLLAARGVDLLRREELHETVGFRRYLTGIVSFPLVLGLLLSTELIWSSGWIALMVEQLFQPTRFQQGSDLVTQRWMNILDETKIAIMFAAGYGLLIYQADKGRWVAHVVPLLLLVLFLLDVNRINGAMLITADLPQSNRRDYRSPAITFLSGKSKEYRTLPLASGTEAYALHKIPVLFTSMPVQKRRWQEYLDALSLQSTLPDIMNVRWLVADEKLYEQNKEKFGTRYPAVFYGGGEVVLENRQVLPKAWLVTRAEQVTDHAERLKRLQEPAFDPLKTALVESPPQLALAAAENPGSVRLLQYEGEQIRLTADIATNCLLVLGEKYHQGWKATVDGRQQLIVPVNHILRGLYLTPGKHTVEFRFDPLPFKIGKWLTLGSLTLFGLIALREWWFWRRSGDAS
jgi:hypothetical protein